ncbi:uncharacterized protein TNCT_696971 [Trichonephila clavata]|uniref:C2H2-type domain-containing protein n=1 Tax=Trichonephila clavata TaxID=2740835 RepID=A0A8X6GGD5_TRICU|nr:uncharacterized protein TNCT_696971 [Trichonephila clavata]
MLIYTKTKSNVNIMDGMSMTMTPDSLASSVAMGFGRPVPYKTFTDEDVDEEPVVTYNCDYCGYRSPTQKGLRCHRLTVHRIGVGLRRTLDSHGRPLAYFG